MKKYIFKLSFCLLLFLTININAQEIPTISMTYIGGSGFLLESPGKKVVIDGVFTISGANGFMVPSGTVLNSIVNAFAPFKDIDVFLLSHSHGDHFDAAMMDKCMQNNPKAVLVCHSDAANSMKTVVNSGYTQYKNRIFVPVLAKFISYDTIINGIALKITQYPPFAYHENGILNFNVEINSIKFLHLLGPEMSNEKYSDPFNDPGNDVLLVGNDYFGTTTVLENYLKFKVAFINHVYQYNNYINDYLTKSSELRKKGNEVYVFKAPMEKYQFTKTGNEIKIDTLVYTSIKHMVRNKNSISIFPNPTTGKIQINNFSTVGERKVLNVFDNSGKLVFNKVLDNSRETLDFLAYPQGNYMFVVENNGKVDYTQKIIILK